MYRSGSAKGAKKYVFYYDLIKIIAAFMVCFYHLGLLDVGAVTEPFYFPNFNKLILNLCAMSVPLFFMVNGALMLRRTYSIKEIVCRVLKIIFLYYFWVIVLGEIGAVFFQIERLSILEILKGNRTTMSVHLWFLRTLAILTALVPVLKRLYDRKSKKMLYAILALLFVFPFFYNYFVLAARWLGMGGAEHLSVTGAFTMYSVLYFLLGIIIADISADEAGDCKKNIIFAVICIITGWILLTIEVTLWSNIHGVVYDGVNSSFPTIGALLMAVGAFYLLSKIQVELNRRGMRGIKILADNIMGVYIFHTIFVSIVLRFVHQTVSVLGVVALTLLIMSVTAMLTHVLKKIPVIRELLTI